MILMIIIVLALLTITIIYINKFNPEGSLKGFKLSFETKNEKDTPSDKK